MKNNNVDFLFEDQLYTVKRINASTYRVKHKANGNFYYFGSHLASTYDDLTKTAYHAYLMENEEPFELENFMCYMEQHFSGMENPFLRTMIENIVEYAVKTKHRTLDEIAYFLSNIIPEVEFGEVAMFVGELHLTEYGKQQAEEFRAKLEEKSCQ